MGKCFVFGCKNYQGKKGIDHRIRFFRFPNNEIIKEKWLRACGNPKVNIQTAFVCSEHFTDEDWELKHRLLDIDISKKRLQKGALPSKNLPQTNEPTERQKRYDIKKRKQIVEEAIAFYDETVTTESRDEISVDENIRLEKTIENHILNYLNLCKICGNEDEVNVNVMKSEESGIFMIANKIFSISIDHCDEVWKICSSCKELLTSLSTFSIHVEKVQKMFLEISKSKTNLNLNELRAKYGINKNFKMDKYIDDNQYDTMLNTENVEKSTDICGEEQIDSNLESSVTNISKNPSVTINSIELYNPHYSDYNLEIDNFEVHRLSPEPEYTNDYVTTEKTILENNSEFEKTNRSIEILDIENENDDKLEENKNITYECDVCFKSLANETELSNHLATIHHIEFKKKVNNVRKRRNNMLSCGICQNVFYRKFLLEQHLIETHNIIAEVPPCECCGKKFLTLSKLKCHLQVHLSAEEKAKYAIPCPICYQNFSKKKALRHHIMGRHSNEKNYVCEKCGKRFSTSSYLSSHRMGQHTEANVICSICQKVCKNRMFLRSHMKTHKPATIPCTTCGTLVKNRSILKNHMLLHSNVCAYKCIYCSKDFKRKVTFKLHMIIHTRLKPFCCRICGEGFANPSNCKKHERRSHKQQYEELEIPSNKFSFQNKLPTIEQLEAILKEIMNKESMTVNV